MANLNPEPWELRKRLKSQRPVNNLKRKVRDRLNSLEQQEANRL